MAWNDLPPTKDELAVTSNEADWTKEPPKKEELSLKEEPSMSDSALRGGIQGATFGLRDELAGAVEGSPLGAIKKLLGSDATDEDVLAYLKARDESRNLDEQARSANPISYTAGNIAGGALVPIPGASLKGLASAESALNAIKSGALVGGLYGAGNAKEADLEGLKDVGKSAAFGGLAGGFGNKVLNSKGLVDTAKNTGLGIGAGAGLGALTSENPEEGAVEGGLGLGIVGAGAGAVKGLSNAAKGSFLENLVNSYKMQKSGKDVLTKAGREAIEAENQGISQGIQDQLLGKRNAYGSDIEKAVSQADTQGLKIDQNPIINKYEELIKKVRTVGPKQAQEKEHLLNVLDDLKNPSGLTADEAVQNWRNIRDIKLDDLENSALKSSTKNLASDLYNNVEQNIPGLKDINKNYSGIMNASESLGVDFRDINKPQSPIETNKLTELLSKYGKNSSVGGRKTNAAMGAVEKSLEGTDPALLEDIMSKAKDISSTNKVVDPLNRYAENPYNFSNIHHAALPGIGATVGEIASGIPSLPSSITNATSKIPGVKTIVNNSKINPENFGMEYKRDVTRPTTPQEYIAKIDPNMEGSNELKQRLMQIDQSDMSKQTAQLFALSQDPKFGPLLRKIQK